MRARLLLLLPRSASALRSLPMRYPTVCPTSSCSYSVAMNFIDTYVSTTPRHDPHTYRQDKARQAHDECATDPELARHLLGQVGRRLARRRRDGLCVGVHGQVNGRFLLLLQWPAGMCSYTDTYEGTRLLTTRAVGSEWMMNCGTCVDLPHPAAVRWVVVYCVRAFVSQGKGREENRGPR